MEKYDFSGWATRNDLLCADGRTIKRDAFKNQNGQTVPLIWGHNHSDPNRVLGHGVLELTQKSASYTRTQSTNEKYTFRTWLLRLGLIGDEFKTARKCLLEHLDGNIAWKDPAQAEAQRQRLAGSQAPPSPSPNVQPLVRSKTTMRLRLP